MIQIRTRASEVRTHACPRGEWDVSWDRELDDVSTSMERGDYPATLTLRYMGVDADAPIGRYLVLGARLRPADDWYLATRRRLLE